MIDTTQDSAVLSFADGALYNNVFGKGDIHPYTQCVFADAGRFGWEWNWPPGTGPLVKAYPEVILGCSPWCKTDHLQHFPCRLADVHHTLEFDLATHADGQWCESFDFWITSNPDPGVDDIVTNLCVWTIVKGLQANYIGPHETLQIGGRIYDVVFETPADHPPKTWTTLFAIEKDFRSSGSLALRPFLDIMIARSLAVPDLFLATAELGTEIACGRGKTIVNKLEVLT
jgi:hypothetical protein